MLEVDGLAALEHRRRAASDCEVVVERGPYHLARLAVDFSASPTEHLFEARVDKFEAPIAQERDTNHCAVEDRCVFQTVALLLGHVAHDGDVECRAVEIEYRARQQYRAQRAVGTTHGGREIAKHAFLLE